ncbi:hypothetical protein [Fusobacterium sp. PH5-44]|uniref:hypothetical protein n=1 Tax=unclassified Fusobacterium TaxID=2648384 RepID=UPI003D1DB599
MKEIKRLKKRSIFINITLCLITCFVLLYISIITRKKEVLYLIIFFETSLVTILFRSILGLNGITRIVWDNSSVTIFYRNERKKINFKIEDLKKILLKKNSNYILYLKNRNPLKMNLILLDNYQEFLDDMYKLMSLNDIKILKEIFMEKQEIPDNISDWFPYKINFDKEKNKISFSNHSLLETTIVKFENVKSVTLIDGINSLDEMERMWEFDLYEKVAGNAKLTISDEEISKSDEKKLIRRGIIGVCQKNNISINFKIKSGIYNKSDF